MARLPRICPPGIPQHIIQRGNNRQACFASEEDFAAYAHWLHDFSNKHHVDIHAEVVRAGHNGVIVAWVYLLVGYLKRKSIRQSMSDTA